MAKAHTVWLFTNRNIAIWDSEGNQLSQEQGMVSCYHIDAQGIARVLEEAEVFNIAKWQEWIHPITRKEMQYLLGLRTLKTDLEELDARQDRGS